MCPVSKNVAVKRASTNVAVVGQGYVGLPLAMRAVQVGHDVVGYDVDPARVKRLAAGGPTSRTSPPRP